MLLTGLFLPNSWADEPEGQAGQCGLQAEAPLVICRSRLSPRCDHIWHAVTLQLNEVITQEAIAALARDLTPLPTLAPCSLCLYLFAKQTQGFTVSCSLFTTEKHCQNRRKEAWCFTSVPLRWTDSIGPLLCCKGQPLSSHTECYVPVCYYSSSLKSLTAKDSSECTNHDINLLHNQKLHQLTTIGMSSFYNHQHSFYSEETTVKITSHTDYQI